MKAFQDWLDLQEPILLSWVPSRWIREVYRRFFFLFFPRAFEGLGLAVHARSQSRAPGVFLHVSMESST